jgi:glycosyltransferase involved in cell wall biosynthesis
LAGKGNRLTPLDYTVVVPTHNRADLLPLCFDALADDSFDRSRYEVLVIDNASRDNTPGVVQEEIRRGRLPVRYYYEGEPGLDQARNAAIRNSDSRFMLFLDDDALVAKGWLAAFDKGLRSGRYQIVQGRIWTRFLQPPPPWFDDEWLPKLGHLDMGDETIPYDGHLHGGNLGVAREVFEKVGEFRPDLDVGAKSSGLGGDTEFGLRAKAAGIEFLYEPDAAMYHLVPPERVTRKALMKRFYISGSSQPLFYTYDESRPRMLLYFLRKTLARTMRMIFTTNARRRMKALFDTAEHWGRVTAILEQRQKPPE